MRIDLTLPREIMRKFERVDKKILEGCLAPAIAFAVADSPDPDKEMLGIRLERALKKRVARAAAKEGMTITEFVTRILIEKTHHITLTSKDYEQIAEQTRKAEAKLKGKRLNARNSD